MTFTKNMYIKKFLYFFFVFRGTGCVCWRYDYLLLTNTERVKIERERECKYAVYGFVVDFSGSCRVRWTYNESGLRSYKELMMNKKEKEKNKEETFTRWIVSVDISTSYIVYTKPNEKCFEYRKMKDCESIHC